MPTKRSRRARPMRARITPEAEQAFAAGDHLALHNALGLKPWEASPLDLHHVDAINAGTGYAASVAKAEALRAALLGEED